MIFKRRMISLLRRNQDPPRLGSWRGEQRTTTGRSQIPARDASARPTVHTCGRDWEAIVILRSPGHTVHLRVVELHVSARDLTSYSFTKFQGYTCTERGRLTIYLQNRDPLHPSFFLRVMVVLFGMSVNIKDPHHIPEVEVIYYVFVLVRSPIRTELAGSCRSSWASNQ